MKTSLITRPEDLHPGFKSEVERRIEQQRAIAAEQTARLAHGVQAPNESGASDGRHR